jgi:hypothetical protein
MPTITIMTPKGGPNGHLTVVVPLCPDCRGTGKVITRHPHSLRIYLRACQRCTEQPACP